MGDLKKLKLGIGQVEVIEGRPRENERAVERAVERALDAGADALVVPCSLTDETGVRLIGLNDSRIDVSGGIAVLEAAGETYRIGLGAVPGECDFRIVADIAPYTVRPTRSEPAGGQVTVRPVGMRDVGRKVLAYDGGSSATAPDGTSILKMRDAFEEDFALLDFSGRIAGREQRGGEQRDDKLLEALVSSIRRFDARVLPFGPRWVIGLSGGLDSSVTAGLLALALGPERVVAYNMATRYNSDATKANAGSIARTLGIEMRGGSIEELVVSLGNALVQYGYPADALKGVILENAQARTRGNLLSTFAAVENGVVVNNGNRIECALGYATLYGDAIGALAPIGDLTKVELFDVARSINARLGIEAVPENLLPTLTDTGYVWETMPSAELANGQVDPMKWFYHDWLVPRLLGDEEPQGASDTGLYDIACDIIEEYLDDKLAHAPAGIWVARYGLDDSAAFAADLRWVLSSMQRATFKRIQAPPVLTLASPASVAAAPESQVTPEPPARFHALMRRLENEDVPGRRMR